MLILNSNLTEKLKTLRTIAIKKEVPPILVYICKKEIHTNIGDVCTLLDYANVFSTDKDGLEYFMDLFKEPSAVFKRFSKLQGFIVEHDTSFQIYMVSERISIDKTSCTVRFIAQSIINNSLKGFAKGDNKKMVSKKGNWSGEVHKKANPSIRDEIRRSIARGDIPPFVYTYPTRSSYSSLDKTYTINSIWKKDETTSPQKTINLYVHYPFCRYKCGFCNLYTVAGAKQSLIDDYTNAIVEQIRQSAHIFKNKTLLTIYFGGGTPMLMSKKNFGQLVDVVEEVVPNWKKTVEEFCIEASPDSIVKPTDPGTVEYFIKRGLTRANLGIQTTNDKELAHISRPYTSSTCWQAIDILKKMGLKNLSTDLIMGFAGQTEAGWMKSVTELIEKSPETISTYFLTVRPDNRFGRMGTYSFYRDSKLYGYYDRAREVLLAAGYIPDSNIRYIKKGKGGYKQKVYQFKGVPVFGVGAGSRSYTNTVDYIIGGNHSPNISQIQDYINNVYKKTNLIYKGIKFNDEERIRKRFALDLFKLDTKELEIYSYSKYKNMLEPLLDALIQEKLVVKKNTLYSLTKSGYKYRDIISWFFYSDDVFKKDAEFYKGLLNKT